MTKSCKALLILTSIILLLIFISTGATVNSSKFNMFININTNTISHQEAIKTHTYGGSGMDSAYSIANTSDGGHVLAGVTDSYGVGQSDMWLVKIDATGRMEWNRTFGWSKNEIANSVIATSDGGYVLAGTTDSYGNGIFNDMFLVKTDATGRMEWNQTFGGTNDDCASSLVVTSDGDYAIAGYTESYATGKLDSDMWLVKINSTGHMEWNQTFGGDDRDGAQSIIVTSDGGYAIAGYTWSYGVGGGGMWLVKTNATGHDEWNRTFGVTSMDMAESVIVTSDGGYAIAGHTESYSASDADMLLVKTNATGHEEWNQTFGGDSFDLAYSIIQTSDGGYAIAGDTESYGAGWADMWLVKTDENGHVEWDQTFGGEYYDVAYSIIQTSDGGYAIAGYTHSYGAGGFDMWLVKTILQDNTNYKIPKASSFDIFPIFSSLLVLVVYYKRKKKGFQ